MNKISEEKKLTRKEISRLGGLSKSPSKIMSSRINGRLGGRPKWKNIDPVPVDAQKERIYRDE